jgi:uncharacterized membrane protein
MALIDNLRFTLTLFATLGCGLMAGLFFAFSVSVMKALARLTPAQGIATMQAINIAILNPVFLAVFLGTAVVSILAIIVSLLRWNAPSALYLLAGGAFYLLGNILVTAVFNVPKNNALDSVSPVDPGSASLWADYLSSWTAWNHVRTITALAATAAFTLALC